MNKKILFIDHDAGWSGATVSLVYLLKEFSLNGFEVIVLTPKSKLLSDRLGELNVRIIRFSSKYLKNLTLDLHFTEKDTISVKYLLRIFKNAVKFLYGLYYINKKLKELRPQILYSNEYVTIYASIAAKYFGIITITHIRSLFLTGLVGVRRYLLNKALLRFNDLIVAISPIESGQLRKNKKNYLTKIIVVSEFIDENDISPSGDIDQIKKDIGVPLNKFVVSMLGGIDPIKGSLIFIESAIECCKENDNYFFIIAGNIPDSHSKKGHIEYYHKCLALIEKSGITNDELLILNTVQNPRQLIECSSVIVSPFLISHYSRPVLESWALKKAVIATRTKHSEQIITHMENGILVNVGDSQGLANSIKLIESNKELMTKLGNNGYSTVINSLDSLNSSNKILSECNLIYNKKFAIRNA